MEENRQTAHYVPPDVEVEYIQTEQGFAGSTSDGDGKATGPEWEVIH